MGMATTNELERIAASLGHLNGVTPHFQTQYDIPYGGLLLALPALLPVGLLEHTSNHFTLPKGYYGLDSLFLLLAMMCLAQISSIEALRYESPEEWGNLLGLDRVPQIKILRDKCAD